MLWAVRGYCCVPGLLPAGCAYNPPNPCPNYQMSTYRWNPAEPGRYQAEHKISVLGADMFCNGFGFSLDGSLIGTGGTLWSTSCSFCPCPGCNATPPGPCCGFSATFNEHTNVWRFDRPTNVWTAMPAMTQGRWYPTTIVLPDGSLFVTGGNSGSAQNSFEILTGSTWAFVSGTAGAGILTGQYPRIHVLSSGLLYMTGYAPTSAFLDLTSTNLDWLGGPVSSSLRDDGGSVYLRTWDAQSGTFTESIYIVGGRAGGVGAQILNSVQRIDNPSATAVWTTIASLNYGRYKANTVVLPTGDIFEVGGRWMNTATGNEENALTPELLNRSGTLQLSGGLPAPLNQWIDVAPHSYGREYHSEAALLPDGTVAVVGGVEAFPPTTSGHSIEVFEPPYLFHSAPRPTLWADDTASYGQVITVRTTPGSGAIIKYTLLRPACVTHSFDFNQRYLELEFTGDQVRMPETPNIAPPGDYMMFAVNSHGVPSVAEWIQIQ